MSLVVNYPKFLENVALPLMQPAVAKLFHEMQYLQPALIAEYACPADQVETQGMIAFFEKEIPLYAIESIKKQMPEIASAFEEAPCEKRHLFSGAIPINNSSVRKLLALTSLFFGYKCRLHVKGLGLNLPLSAVEQNEEYYDFLGRIPGITLMERCDPKKDFRVCHSYVFGDFAWYKTTIQPNTKLLVEPKKVLDFLQSKGFTKSKNPAKDQVVVYHTASKTNHFAKVLDIDSNGKVMVISKFGLLHIYTHSVGLAQWDYGNSVTFLNPPAK